MIIDTSALVAILTGESDYSSFAWAIHHAATRRISAATYLEASIVLNRRRNPVLSTRLDELIEEVEIVIEAVTAAQAKIAWEAYRDFGRGSGHAANLNFGDCFTYALAREKREPVLWKGDDFVHTDLRAAAVRNHNSPTNQDLPR
jgi:ribonuclease VapC